jgi:peptidoglycan hydrolase-like protein with peptidoglycan-binding domain
MKKRGEMMKIKPRTLITIAFSLTFPLAAIAQDSDPVEKAGEATEGALETAGEATAEGLEAAGKGIGTGVEATGKAVRAAGRAVVDFFTDDDDDEPSANDNADRVREVQRALKSRGLYEGEIDGIAGPLTRNGLTTFQRSQENLEATGQVDAATARALGVESESD